MYRMKQFLDAIIAAPADGLLRLVFADWLEEQGMLTEATIWRQATMITLQGNYGVRSPPPRQLEVITFPTPVIRVTFHDGRYALIHAFSGHFVYSPP